MRFKMYILLVGVLSLSLTACGKVSQIEAKLTGNAIECVQGVQYIQLSSGVTVMYNQDGSIKTCKGGLIWKSL